MQALFDDDESADPIDRKVAVAWLTETLWHWRKQLIGRK